MMEFDANKPKNFKFDINIDGISPDVLVGFLRLEINNIEYGFPAEIRSESISADIPALKGIIHRELKNGERIRARLDVIGDGYYMGPWSDELVVKSSVVLEAKLVESDKPVVSLREKSPQPKQMIKKSKEPIIQKPKQVVKEQDIPITKEMIFHYMERNGTKNKEIQKVLLEQASMKIGDDPKTLLKFFITFYKKNADKLSGAKK